MDRQIKGAGHTANPGYSATPGVQIAMKRFTEVTYDAEAGVAKIGAGNVWDNVYAALEPFNVSVVGGRVSGIGVAGFTLGGGGRVTTLYDTLNLKGQQGIPSSPTSMG